MYLCTDGKAYLITHYKKGYPDYSFISQENVLMHILQPNTIDFFSHFFMKTYAVGTH